MRILYGIPRDETGLPIAPSTPRHYAVVAPFVWLVVYTILALAFTTGLPPDARDDLRSVCTRTPACEKAQ